MTPRRSAANRASLRDSRATFVTILVVASLLMLASANPRLSLACILVFAWIWSGALASPFRTALAAYLSLQWCQVAFPVGLANLYGASLDTPQSLALEPSSAALAILPTTPGATLFGLGAIGAISLGFRLVPGTSRPFDGVDVHFRPAALLGTYSLFLTVDLFVAPSFQFGSLGQAILVLGELRYVPAALLLYQWILTRRGGGLCALLVLLEVLIGFAGYFSQFKQIFIILATVLLSLVPYAWRRVFPVLCGAIATVLLLGAAWTAVKTDYRSALSQGRAEQVVAIGVGDRIGTLRELMGQQSRESLGTSMIVLANRIGYTTYLAFAMQRTPGVQPHADGALWSMAVQNVLAPRFLFPSKPPLVPDSETTMRYTGQTIAGTAQGTSISMGYAADAYVDFGTIGGLFLCFALGACYGLMTAIIAGRAGGPATFVAVACVIVMLMPVGQFEMSSVKLLGGIIWSFLGALIFMKLIWPATTTRLVDRRRRPARRRPEERVGVSKLWA